MNRIRLAVVGVGALGQHHARKLAAMERVDLVAVVDARREQGESVAAACGTTWLPHPGGLAGRIDAAVIAVPTEAHFAVAAPLLSSGIPVLIEKPIAVSLAESQALHELAEQHGTQIQVGHIERFNPAFEIVRQRVRNPKYIRCQRVSPYAFRSMDIGVVHDLMIHDIDLILALTQSQAVAVEAFGAVTIGPHEDFAVARLKLQSGTIVDLTAGRMCPHAERTLQVWDEAGYFSADLHQRRVSIFSPSAAVSADPSHIQDLIAAAENPMSLKPLVFQEWIRQEELTADNSDALEAELTDFVNYLHTGTSPRVTSIDAIRAMKIAERVLAEISVHSYQNAAGATPLRRAA